MRKLAPDEAEAWARVAATIRPLHVQQMRAVDGQEILAPVAPMSPPRRPTLPPRPSPAQPVSRTIGQTLDSSWDKSLRGGTVSPDRILDLHGMNLDSAWQAIDRTLEAAIVAGDRVLLLITGHARSGDPPIQRGRIRAAVHDWLNASRHAVHIAAVRNAHRRHGGGGSLYVVLRRQRRPSTVS